MQQVEIQRVRLGGWKLQLDLLLQIWFKSFANTLHLPAASALENCCWISPVSLHPSRSFKQSEFNVIVRYAVTRGYSGPRTRYDDTQAVI